VCRVKSVGFRGVPWRRRPPPCAAGALRTPRACRVARAAPPPPRPAPRRPPANRASRPAGQLLYTTVQWATTLHNYADLHVAARGVRAPRPIPRPLPSLLHRLMGRIGNYSMEFREGDAYQLGYTQSQMQLHGGWSSRPAWRWRRRRPRGPPRPPRAAQRARAPWRRPRPEPPPAPARFRGVFNTI